MLSVIIPTYNTGNNLTKVIAQMRMSPEIGEVIVVDGGSNDDTLVIAQKSANQVMQTTKGRGQQMKAGASAATGDWLFFLHSDTVLQADWAEHIRAFMANKSNVQRAGYFRFMLDDDSVKARVLEKIVSWRCRFLGLPYGDQGLLISRRFYDEIGGYKEIALMEDVDIVRRIGNKRLKALSVAAMTSSIRYQKHGYVKRMIKNVTCLSLYFLGLSPAKIVKLYE